MTGLETEVPVDHGGLGTGSLAPGQKVGGLFAFDIANSQRELLLQYRYSPEAGKLTVFSWWIDLPAIEPEAVAPDRCASDVVPRPAGDPRVDKPNPYTMYPTPDPSGTNM